MGVNKKYLQGIEALQKEYLELGDHMFIKKYQKYDAFIGPNESHEFIKKIFNQKNQSKCTTSQK